MIKSLYITNFQSHEKTKLNFHNGVNVIVGDSDSGKTAIMRALRWLSWNRPSGDSIRSNWGGTTNVILETEEGFVRRVKDKKDKYELKIHGKNSLVFHAFGTNVPQEIVDFLNLSEINLQRQLDAPFLLSKTPGQVASHFNKVARLDKIDIAMSNVKSWINNLTSTIKHKREDIKKNIQELKEFDYLEQFETELEVLEEMEDRSKNLKVRYDKLLDLCTSYHEVDTAIRFESEILVIEEPLNALLTLINEKKEHEQQYTKLDSLIQTIKDIDEDINKYNEVLTIETNVTNLLKLYKKRNEADEKYERLYNLLNSLDQIDESIIIAEKKYKALCSKFEKEMIICPLCGTKLK